MSGGTFDYKQYYIDEIASDVEQLIRQNGAEIEYSQLESWDKNEWSENHNDKTCTKKNYDEDPNHHYEYPEEIMRQYKVGHVLLTLAGIYAQRIDYLEAADDGEDSFLRRLKEDISYAKTYTSDCQEIIKMIEEKI